MPPSITGRSASPPPAALGGNNSAKKPAEGERSKHIEVCVRLRPLVVQKETSGSSFFHSNQHRKQRKPTIPRVSKLPTASSARGGAKNRSSNSPRDNNNNKANESLAAAAATTDCVYAWDVVTDDTVAQSPATDIIPGRTHTYTLDKVYGPDRSTLEVYNASVKDLVHAAMDGYHTAVMAYGQTSTGKTHTMTGTVQSPGFIPLAVRECFTRLRGNREYLIRISYLEVYKEHIRDLLATSVAPPPIRLFETKTGDLQIKGLQEEVVTSPEQVFGLLAQGEARRQVGATHLNQHSSRSHVMVRIWIESREQRSTSNNSKTTVSSLSLVDLAGSESVRLSGSSERRSEGHFINQSLMTLGQVVYALSEAEDNGDNKNRYKKKQHVPYRDSKLTRLLQPSLSGNAQVVLLCCVSPLPSHVEESHNTFKFAIRAKKIPQRAVLGLQGDADEKTLLQSYREEIEDLKLQLKEAREQREQLLSKTFSETSTTSTITRSPSAESLSPDDADMEMEELVAAIQHMERLILKTTPGDDDEDLDVNDDSLAVSPRTPDRNTIDVPPSVLTNGSTTTPQRDKKREDLKSELSRIQILLSSVLKKRARYHHGAAMPAASAEVRDLRAQLEQQEVATSLRQADSSFLQKQLAEKDELLAEVSKILEQVEERQEALEAENKALRKQLEVLRAAETR